MIKNYKDGSSVTFESYKERSERLNLIAGKLLELFVREGLTLGEAYEVIDSIESKLLGLTLTGDNLHSPKYSVKSKESSS